MKISLKIRAMVAFAAAALIATPAFAHHSGAMFDTAKSITLEGTVKEFQWTNPHAWVQLVARDPVTGKDVEWSLELNSISRLIRNGWTRTSLKPGDKAVAVFNPLKDGGTGGHLDTITVDGKKMVNGINSASP